MEYKQYIPPSSSLSFFISYPSQPQIDKRRMLRRIRGKCWDGKIVGERGEREKGIWKGGRNICLFRNMVYKIHGC